TDQKAAIGRRELRKWNRPQPRHHGGRRALVAPRILDGQLVQQRLSPGIVWTDRQETQLARRGWLAGSKHHYMSNVSLLAAFRPDYAKTART
ncbi:MAG: hypothetical protein QOG14_4050, partial [Mycobacterium sp.]|nr:hypothetical protein [Mycobacterium sp.]